MEEIMASYFPGEGLFIKGCLHSHSTVTDGEFSPEELADKYRNAGYGFLAITDHNILLPHKELQDDKFILLTGLEHDIAYTPNKCIHLIGISKEGKYETDYPCRRYSAGEISDQSLVDMMNADGQFVFVAHPLWSRMEPEELESLQGYRAVEVYNHDTERAGHEGHSEVCWELLLRHGKRINALATDDTHIKEGCFGGWVCVKAEDMSERAILKALYEGAYYASTGPEIYDFGLDGKEAYLKCSACREIYFVCYPARGSSVIDRVGASLTEARHRLCGGEKYIRAVCVDEKGNKAWTNPIYFD